MKSPLKYIGSKNIDLNKYNIDQSNIYCEAFGGGFNTGLNIIEQGFQEEINKEVIYNDLDTKVYNFWKQLQTDPVKLITEIDNIINNDKISDDCSKEIQDAATEFIYRKNLKLGHGKNKTRYSSFIDMELVITSEIIQNIEIYNKSVFSLFEDGEIGHKLNNKDAFILFDPPYITNNVDRYYRCNSSEFEHYKLSKLLRGLKSRWLLTYNNKPIIRELYADYNIEEKHKTLYNRDYIELYITNF